MIELAHVVFYVRDLEQSLHFYTRVVGLEVKDRIFNDRAAILSTGHSHHELLLIQVGDAPGPLTGRRVGLYHVGWKIGDTLDELRVAKQRVLDNGYTIAGMSDHTVSKSMYLTDPDDNELELFVDDPSFDWRNDSSWLEAPVKPLSL